MLRKDGSEVEDTLGESCVEGSDLCKGLGSDGGDQGEALDGHVLCWCPVPAPAYVLAALCCGLGVPPELDAAAHLEGLPDGALLQYSLSTTPPCGVGPC